MTIKYIILSVLAGVLIGISLPNLYVPFAFVFGFLILFNIISKGNVNLTFFYSFLTGFVFSLISFYWVNNAIVHYGNVNIFVSVLLYILLSSAFSLVQFVIPSIFTSVLIKRYSTYGILLFPFFWVWIELLREFFPFTGFPWNFAGYMLSYINPVSQIAEFIGIYGLSFLTVFIPVALFYHIKSKSTVSFSVMSVTVLLLIGVYIFGYIKIENFAPEGEKYRIAILQGNIPEEIKQDLDRREEVLDIYIRLFKEAAKEKPNLIVLPESALPFPPLAYDNPLKNRFFREIEDIKVAFLSGFDNYFTLNKEFYLYNSIFLYNEEHNSIYFYNKIKLVPFGEYVPPLFEPFKKLFPYLQGYDFRQGKEITTLNYKKMRIVPLICFEAIFSTFVGNFIKKGGNIIINITNDAWFGKTSAPYQHFEMARVRAIEYKLYLVRAANTGISAIVNPVGEIEKSLGLFKRGFIVGDVYINPYYSGTFYLKYRKILLLIFFVITVVLLFFREKRVLDITKRRLV